jgi:hypothetical protein
VYSACIIQILEDTTILPYRTNEVSEVPVDGHCLS